MLTIWSSFSRSWSDTGGVVRLALADYHHVHFPDLGVPHAARSIPGRYHAGGPYAAHGGVAGLREEGILRFARLLLLMAGRALWTGAESEATGDRVDPVTLAAVGVFWIGDFLVLWLRCLVTGRARPVRAGS